MYSITEYTKQKARSMGLEVKPSVHKGKKIDVYKDGKFIHSIGAIGYKDYPTFLKTEGKAVAEEHQRRYKQRHTQHTLGEQLALHLLW